MQAAMNADIGDIGHPVGYADCRRGDGNVLRAADEGGGCRRVEPWCWAGWEWSWRLRRRVIFRRKTPRRGRHLRQLHKRLPVDVLAGDVIHPRPRPATAQQLGVVDLVRFRRRSAPPAHCEVRRPRPTSPSCSTVSAAASSMAPLRRMRWMKTRASGTSASASAALRPAAFTARLHPETRAAPSGATRSPPPPSSLVPPCFSSYSLHARRGG